MSNNFQTKLTKVSNTYFPMIRSQLEENSIEMSDYQKQCVMNSISAINNVLDEKNISWNDKQLDNSNLTDVMLSVASLELNASANPREIYFQIRNINTKKGWKKQIEMGIEGDGNDALLSRFGRNVQEVMNYWKVRENDKFEYPSYIGLEMTPPKWTPQGEGKVVKIVYPIIKESGVIEYHIGERGDVKKNLLAHISNNMMNETFGIAENKYKATSEQKEEINAKKKEIRDRADTMQLDDILADESLQKYISPAWKDPQSRESMIERKIRNNIVKKIPKDFGKTLISFIYDKVENAGEYQNIRKEVNEEANQEELDIEDAEEVESEPQNKTQNEPKKEPIPEPEKPEKEDTQPKNESENKEKEENIDMEDDVPF